MPVVAVVGLIGTLVFGLLWAGEGGSAGADPAMTSAARVFMTDLTNFNAKSIDADFNAITSMATGTFSGQASKFFNSSIRSELQDALAESRGQIRDLYVQSESAHQGSVYVVDDQVYANNKITTPQSDVLRVVVNLAKVGTVWKISDVTVLEGPPRRARGAPRDRRAPQCRASSGPPRRHTGPASPPPRPAAARSSTLARAACGSVVASRGQSQAKRPT